MGKKPTVYLYTDGACSGNPGPGGWGAILQSAGVKEKTLSGGEKSTTNNRMEMMAVIEGLRALKRSCHVVITSDSRYVIDSITKGWVFRWQKNGWMRNQKDKALNSDLWEQLLQELEKHEVEYVWVKGHESHDQNIRCDEMAVEESHKFK